MAVDFELATKEKYRFPFKGMISAEDLWDLDVNQLDSVFKALNKEKKSSEEESLLTTTHTKADVVLTNKIDIVRYIYTAKQLAIQERREAAKKHERNERIKELLAKHQDEALAGPSTEELQKLLEE